MYVEFGNDQAVEGYRDPNSDDPELVRYRDLPGERVTTITFPKVTDPETGEEREMGLQEAFSTAVTALSYHMKADSRPTWVDSDSEGLRALLAEHFGLTQTQRPPTWGRSTGAEAPADASDDDDGGE